MYSLVSASVLGHDLSRLPGGVRVAAVLRVALALGPADLHTLTAAVLDAGDSKPRRAACAAALDVARRLVRTADAPASGSGSRADVPPCRVTPGLLEQAATGHVHGLVRLVRDDVLAWTSSAQGDGGARPEEVADAVEAVVDAAVAAYVTGLVEPGAVALLAAPWAAAQPVLPAAAADTGPCGERVAALLGRAARLGAVDLERLQVAADAARRPRAPVRRVGWAPAMHSATWAVHLADRLGPAAVAQLRLVEAVHGRVPVGALDRGCWWALSGAVQAEVVRDLIDPETHDALAGGTLLALGLPA